MGKGLNKMLEIIGVSKEDDEDFDNTFDQPLSCSIVRVSFTCKQELYRIIRIVHDLRKTIQVGEQQVCTFVSSKTTAETNQQCVRIDLIHQ